MPSAGLLAIATIISGLKTRPEHRKWRLLAAILARIVVVFTIAWFVPNIIKLEQGGAGLSAEQITGLTNWWVKLNWVRAVLVAAA